VGADVNTRDSLGMTPLHRAVLLGSADKVKLEQTSTVGTTWAEQLHWTACKG